MAVLNNPLGALAAVDRMTAGSPSIVPALVPNDTVDLEGSTSGRRGSYAECQKSCKSVRGLMASAEDMVAVGLDHLAKGDFEEMARWFMLASDDVASMCEECGRCREMSCRCCSGDTGTGALCQSCGGTAGQV